MKPLPRELPYEELRRRAQAIAESLPAGWTFHLPTQDEPHHTRIDGPDGAGMWISQDRDGRLSIAGEWPKNFENWYFYPRQDRPAITVSADRSPASIAADIARRFLPGYLPEYQKQAKQREDIIASTAAARTLAHELASMVGTCPAEWRPGHFSAFRSEPTRLWVEGEVNSPDCAHLKMDCTPAQARAVLRAYLDTASAA